MRIGRLRKRSRRFTELLVEQEYYRNYTFFDAFGDLKARIPPFDGKAFLNWDWHWQYESAWYGRSVDGMIPAALIDYGLIWEKETKAHKKYRCLLTRFFRPYGDVKVNCTFNLEGVWIEWGEERDTPRITVLKTTRMQVKFKAETREVLLPPGAIVRLSPLTLMQKLGENISIKKHSRRIPPKVMEVFATAKTPLELAARLELEPIRLREELVNKVGVMRR